MIRHCSKKICGVSWNALGIPAYFPHYFNYALSSAYLPIPFSFFFLSANRSFNREYTINGQPNTTEAVCNADRPPVKINIAAIAPSLTPQRTLKLRGGFGSPCDVSIPLTYVAESDDVIKNIVTESVPNKIRNLARGKVANAA